MINLREAASEAFIGADSAEFENNDVDQDEKGAGAPAMIPRGQNDAKLCAGWRKLLRRLSLAFPRSAIRELPEKVDAFFEQGRF